MSTNVRWQHQIHVRCAPYYFAKWLPLHKINVPSVFSLNYIKPPSLFRLWSSNLLCRNYFSPLCLCWLLQIIGHSNFSLFCIMSPISHKRSYDYLFWLHVQSKYANIHWWDVVEYTFIHGRVLLCISSIDIYERMSYTSTKIKLRLFQKTRSWPKRTHNYKQ